MRVGLDFDGTLVDFVGAFQQRYEAWFGAPLIQPVVEWDDILLFSHFDNYKDLFDWCDRANVWAFCEWIPGAPHFIDQLLQAGHQVVFLTSRQTGAADWIRKWHEDSLWSETTQLVTNLGDAKYTVPCSVYIDDSPGVIAGLVENEKNVIVIDRPWNQKVDKKLPRAKSWSEVAAYIEELNQ